MINQDCVECRLMFQTYGEPCAAHDLEMKPEQRARLLRALDEPPAVTRARAKGWSVNAGETRLAGPLDDLALRNNNKPPGVSTRVTANR